jgi:hypothetical protein
VREVFACAVLQAYVQPVQAVLQPDAGLLTCNSCTQFQSKLYLMQHTAQHVIYIRRFVNEISLDAHRHGLDCGSNMCVCNRGQRKR